MALGRGEVVSPLGQIPGTNRDRGTGGAEAVAAEPFRRLRASARQVQLSALQALPRLCPDSAIALAARVKIAGKDFAGEQRELYLSEKRPGQEAPYERLLGDAMNGEGALFTREDAVEAAWAAVDPVLKTHHRARPYKHRSWGPKEADAIFVSGGSWHNPKPEEPSGGLSLQQLRFCLPLRAAGHANAASFYLGEKS